MSHCYQPIFAHFPDTYSPGLIFLSDDGPKLQRQNALRHGYKPGFLGNRLCKQVVDFMISPMITSSLSLDSLDTDEYKEVIVFFVYRLFFVEPEMLKGLRFFKIPTHLILHVIL